MDKVYIFDTTLRDGEQAPGASLTVKEKIEVAWQLERLNVDIIEAGFPIASEGDFEAVNLIAKKLKKPIICGLARSLKKDIDAARDALKPAKRKRIHVFLATSNIHMQYKLKKAKDEVLKQAVKAVKYAKQFADDVEFSPEDASRTERKFLFKVISEVINAGATVVNIPDTVGYAVPDEFSDLIIQIKKNVSNMDEAIISVHCHDDLGLSCANSLAAVKVGAKQVECTINGIGERAGSASLEEVVMALKTREDFFNFKTSIKTQELHKTSRLVSHLMAIPVQPNKAIVGANAFRHESGIHQDGVLKMPKTYEIMTPFDVGFKESNMVLGKHSGRHAFMKKLEELDIKLSKHDFENAFDEFKKLADKKKEIFDDDIIAIVEEGIEKAPKVWSFVYVHTVTGSSTVPTATVKLKKDNKIHEDAACGDGPIDACYNTIDRIIGFQPKLLNYNLKAVTSGRDALGEVTVRLKHKNKEIVGRGTSTDIIEASTKAYLNAVNKIVS
ncbi:MAG: 2-isopropylmalate synthase [Candidatus Saelkia tenebricola]|nr:2-isopropylmalate synthase [Candidatus Saelkia tenebricola]